MLGNYPFFMKLSVISGEAVRWAASLRQPQGRMPTCSNCYSLRSRSVFAGFTRRVSSFFSSAHASLLSPRRYANKSGDPLTQLARLLPTSREKFFIFWFVCGKCLIGYIRNIKSIHKFSCIYQCTKFTYSQVFYIVLVNFLSFISVR